MTRKHDISRLLKKDINEALLRVKPCQYYDECHFVRFDRRIVYYPYLSRTQLNVLSSSLCKIHYRRYLKALEEKND